MRKRNLFFLIVLMVVVPVLFSGCLHNPPRLNLTIQDHSWIIEHEPWSDFWKATITGHAINDGNVTIGYVEVWAKIYNNDSQVIWESFDHINNLLVGEIWEFSIVYWWSTTEPHHYSLLVDNLRQ